MSMNMSKKRMCLVVTMAIAMVFGTMSSAMAKDKSFAPFERVAVLDAVFNEDGSVNEFESYLKAQAVGNAIAAYIDATDEAAVLGYPSNWIVAGADSTDTVEDAVLMVPSAQKITKADGTVIPKKIKVIEICNKAYASKALGVKAIVNDMVLANGMIHAPALPCEISVHNDGNKIHVNMLDATAIFTLFFTDVLTGEQMLDPDFAEQMGMLPGAVKGEMRGMILAALADNDDLIETFNMAGPIYKNLGDAISAVAQTENQSPYVHFTYSKVDGTAFTSTEVAAIAATITETMSIHGEPDAGTHDEALDELLSAGSSWRAARHKALKMPGANFVIEACSPKYAKMAISTNRLDHAPALPCEIALNKIDNGSKLIVSYLDPHFMFDIMFGDMSEAEKVALGDLPGVVLGDLQNIVNFSIDNDLAIDLNEGVQVYYDMLQAACDDDE